MNMNAGPNLRVRGIAHWDVLWALHDSLIYILATLNYILIQEQDV